MVLWDDVNFDLILNDKQEEKEIKKK